MNNTDEVETRAGSDSSKELVLDCGDGVQLDMEEVTTFYLALVPRVFQEGFEIEIECTNGFTLTKSTKGSFAIRRNTVYKMKEFDVNPNAEEVPLTPLVEFLDVSGSEGGTKTANSYIITGEGYYKFPAVKGNDNTQTVGDVAKVEVLWESFGTDEAPEKRDLITALDYIEEENYIYFETTDKKGNALIAAKDADNNILWSWHIWMTDEPKDQVYKNNAGTMMDRNLGATSATRSDGVKTHGLLYQWGRKDPFLGKTNGGNRAASTLDPYYNWPTESVTKTQGKIDYSIKNPTIFITAGTGEGERKWMTEENVTLWAYDKTIYDPCPPGYQVPDGSSSGIWATALGQSDELIFSGFYDMSNKGFFFLSHLDQTLSESADVWYPYTAEIEFETGVVNTNLSLNVWAYNVNADLNMSKTFGCAYAGGLEREKISPSKDRPQAQGLAVRCYKTGAAGAGGDN